MFGNSINDNRMANDKGITELDKKLQEIAASDWQRFVAMVGEDAVISAKVCLLRQNGNSYGQITRKLSLTVDKVRWECKQCDS